MSNPCTVLVTAVGGDIGRAVVRVLRRLDIVGRIIGTDVHDDHPTVQLVDRFAIVPDARALGYVEHLDRLIGEEHVGVVIPISEPEIATVHAARERGWAPSARCLLAGGSVLPTCLDKLETMQWLRAHGIAVPWTMPVTAGSPRATPCILKNRRTWGSKSIERIDDAAAAAFWAARRPDAIFQEILEPPEEEYTCGIFRDSHQRTATIILRRKLVGGLTGTAVVVADPTIEALCRAVADAFDLSGSINLQLRNTSAGPMPFEVNPRFSSTVMFRDLLGFRDVEWSLRDALGMPLPPMVPLPTGMRMYRVFSEVLVPACANVTTV